MRFEVTLLKDRFPFIAKIRWQLLSRPEIDISVKATGLPDMMEVDYLNSLSLPFVLPQFLYCP
jgi:Ca2+-dependent lipid-binding protein